MRGVLSLRGRLTAIILGPLLVVAGFVGLWQINTAQRTATDVFDKSLLAAALAVSNDVTVSGGDALSPRTGSILSDTSGGPVFYHVYAPDGVIVAGYATPPVGIPRADAQETGPTYFDASYLGRSVHGVRLQSQAQIDGFSGIFTTTVWQDAAVRAAFVRDLVLRSFLATCGLIAAVALIVWFGVHIGLRPLTDLQNAIARRSSDELTPIQRAVPSEVEGIVQTLNRLFDQVSHSMTAQSEFISNAAHQLRNPIAGVLSLAEAVQKAPDMAASRERSGDLLKAAQETAELSQKLLLLERAKAISPAEAMQEFDLDAALEVWMADARAVLPASVTLTFDARAPLGRIKGDPTMLQEALRNLIDNALRHGGAGLSRIVVSASHKGPDLRLAVTDDGVGIGVDDMARARQRFGTGATSLGSGLGVSIVEAIAQAHGGTFELLPQDAGLRAELRLRVAA